MELLQKKNFATQPVASFDWNMDKEVRVRVRVRVRVKVRVRVRVANPNPNPNPNPNQGLAVMGCLDQTVRVIVCTKLHKL